jgi:glutamine amidotransferase
VNGERPSIAILDYGMGNLRSVEKALERVGARPYVGADSERVRESAGLVLPGVGAFPEAMGRIRTAGLDGLIAERVEAGVPLLGLCLGMQLLFESSSEHEGTTGLGLLAGPVEPLRADGLKLPHIGWEPIRIERSSPIGMGIADGEPFYFVHSLVARARAEDTIATSVHGERFPAVVGSGRVFGTQFHPEKSSAAGLRLLGNFVAACAPAAVA